MRSIILSALLSSSLAFVASTKKTFVVPHTEGADDAVALRAALANYTSDSIILFKKGKTYNIWTPVNFGKLTNVEIAFEGNVTLPESISEVQAIVADASFPGQWFTVAGTNVIIRGTPDPQWGWINGNGQAWWDAMNQTNRPHGWSFKSSGGGVVKDMKFWKPIAWNWSLQGTDIHAYNNKILAASSTGSFPFNTDGFSATGSNILIENNYIVNGDDCITVGNGANGVTFRNNHCEGGHGLSIGSLGKNGQVASVANVLIENNVMVNSLYGARFKSWLGGQGLASNITWRNIVLQNVPFPIFITQNYWDQGASGPIPPSDGGSSTNIENFLFENFAGTLLDTPGYVEGSCISDPCWYAVPKATGHEVAIFDLYPGTAKNIVAKRLAVVTKTGEPLRVMCNSTVVTNDVGFKCIDGLYQPTKVGLF